MASAGESPGDVEAVTPQDQTAHSVRPRGVEAGDHLPFVIERLHRLIDANSSFGRYDPAFRGSQGVVGRFIDAHA